jgi:hypothetical protein
LAPVLNGDERSASRSFNFTPRDKAPGIDCIYGHIGFRAVLDDMEKNVFFFPGLGKLCPSSRLSSYQIRLLCTSKSSFIRSFPVVKTIHFTFNSFV